MIRKHFYISQEELDYLKKLPGTVSDHIRRAISEYIEDIQKQKYSASQSRKEEYGTASN